MHEAPPMPRGLNFPSPPPTPNNQNEPTRADLRRSLITELSIEMESLERDYEAKTRGMSQTFDRLWDNHFGVAAFTESRNAFKKGLGL